MLFLMYFGLGPDAETCYLFDKFRKLFPYIFGIKKLNKIYYAFCFIYMYFKNMIFQVKTYYRKSRLTVNGKNIRVSGLSNVILMNGFCRSGGINNEWDKNLPLGSYKKQNMSDGLFEVFGLKDASHLAKSTVFVKRPDNIGQGERLEFEFLDD